MSGPRGDSLIGVALEESALSMEDINVALWGEITQLLAIFIERAQRVLSVRNLNEMTTA